MQGFASQFRSFSRRSLNLILFFSLLSGVSSLNAQVAQQLSGRVSDATGAVVADATVIVTNEETGVTFTTKTSRTGDWVAPYLRPDVYTVKVDSKGFETSIVNHIKLDVGQLRSVDTKLQVGLQTSEVTVTATTLALATEDADQKTVVPGALVVDLPQNFRNVMAATIDVVGIGSKNGLYNTTAYGSVTGGLVFNSSAGSLNIDGVNNMSTGFQAMAYLPLLDTVQEMVVDATPYDAAAVGFATGGNIDVHLKSGTNKLHGTVYWYYKSTGLDANTYSNKYNSAISTIPNCAATQCIGRPSHKSNQVGFEADGPVRIPHLYNGRDKTFFTIAFEDFNQTTPGGNTFSVPGVFGQPSWLTPVGGYYQFTGLTQSNGAAITLYDPATIGYGGNAAARESFLQEGAPNAYSIPASRVNQTALNILKYFPAPNRAAPAGSAPWQNNYFVQTSIKSIYKNFMIKIDHTLTDRDRLTLRYGRWDQFQTQNSNGFPAGNPAEYGQFPNGQAFTDPYIEYVHTFSPKAIFDFKASINTDEAHLFASGKFDQTSVGLPDVSAGLTQPNLLGFFPQVSLSSFTQMGSTGSNYQVHHQLSILPSFTLVHGPHNLHLGIDNREYQIETRQGSGGLAISASQAWTQAFNNNTADAASGSSVASFLLDNGYLSGGSLSQPSQQLESYHYWGAYIQDNYKVTNNLTLNLGIRYDFPNQAVDRHDRYTNVFNTAAVSPIAAKAVANGFAGGSVNGALTFSGQDGVARTQIPRAWYMFEPRVGGAYQIDAKTVLRGGVGGSYNWAAYTGAQTGFSATTSITPSLTTNYTTPYAKLTGPGSPNSLFPSGYVPAPGASLGAYAGLGTGISFYNPATHFGETWTYSLGVQRQLTKGDILEVGYVGKNFSHGPTGESINSPSPGWFAQCNAEAGGTPSKCLTNVANPFANITASVGTLGVVNPFAGTSLAAATINSGQLLLPFPQYTGVSENGRENRSGLWLNSLQVTETHRFAESLTATTTYEYARIMDNNGVFDYSNGTYTRQQDGNDLNHRITFSGVYKLPVGRGRRYMGSMNRVLDAAIGGWMVGSVYVYESGRPWQPQCGGGQNSGLGGSTGCLQTPFGLSAIQQKRTVSVVNGVRTIRGTNPCVADRNATTGIPILRAGAISAGCTQANWAYKTQFAPAQMITSVGIRLGASSEFDANLQKSFEVYESLKFTLRCDAFNATNHAVWSGNYSTSNDANFGAILEGANSGQSNNPRSLQLSGTFRF